MDSESRIALVTDSACSIPGANDLGATVVPAIIVFDGQEEVPDGSISPSAFYERMKSAKRLPSTAAPPSITFQDVYDRLAEEGYTDIISIHVSSALSRIHESASQAGPEAEIPVTVVDSKNASCAAGLLVKYASDLIARGLSIEEIEERIAVATKNVFFYVALDTTANIVESGRLGKAAGALTKLLQIKPILGNTEEGTLEVVAKPRTMKKATAKVIELAKDKAAEKEGKVSRVVVIHTNNLEEAQKYAQEVREAFGDDVIIEIEDAGAGIAVHAGENGLGLACLVEP